VSYEKIGNAQLARGNPAEALQAHRSALAIRERLAGSDPGNATWQRDLVLTYAKLARIYLKTGRSSDAREALLAGRAVLARLIGQHPDLVQEKGDADWFDRELAALGK
jgi:hypothetical protein